MLLSKTLNFYKLSKVQSLIVHHARDKEIAVQFGNFFGKRPDAIYYENDVLEFCKKKATSFHCSEELWTNPLSIRSDMKKVEQDELRSGWDLILDIDCAHFVYSKLATHILINVLRDLGIGSVTCKFSGNKGFHIAVPFESFPKSINGVPTKNLFPEAPRKIAFYLKDKLKPLLEKAIMRVEKGDIDRVVKRTGIKYEDLVSVEADKFSSGISSIDSEKFLEIDTILIASRHLYRMPYSFHEKSGLISVPVPIDEVLKFKKEMADYRSIRTDVPFLDRSLAKEGECGLLVMNAYDFYPTKKEEVQKKKEFDVPEDAISDEKFPPCIKLMLEGGFQDGKKRSLFTIINFLRGAGWSVEQIENKIREWNSTHEEPLREVYLKGQLAQLKKKKEVFPPHNCPQGGSSYFQDLGFCNPDNFCSRVKNPLQYSSLKHANEQSKKAKGRPKLTEKQKEMRKKFRDKKKKDTSSEK